LAGVPLNPVRMLARLWPSREDRERHGRDYLLCAASGVAGWFVFPEFCFAELAWVALVPYFVALRRLEGASLVRGTMLFGVVWFYGNLWWLNTLFVFNPFIPIGVVLLAAVCASYLLLFAFPARWCLRRCPPRLALPCVAALWTGVEHLRSFTELAFPWNLLGHSQVVPRMMTMVQIADLGGVAAISFLIVLANAALAQLVSVLTVRRSSGTNGLVQAVVHLAVVAAILTAANAYGVMSLFRWSGRVGGADGLRVSVVQPNTSQMDKWTIYSPETSPEQRTAMETNMLRTMFDLMAAAAAEQPALIVLPEAVIVSPWFVYERELHRALEQFAADNRTDLLLGADNREPWESYSARRRRGFRPPRAGDKPTSRPLPQMRLVLDERGETVPLEASPRMAVFASVWQVKADSGLQPFVYDKVQLVPFGEQAPILGHIPYFQDRIMMVGSFQAGTEQTLFETGGTRYGALICFESTFARLAAHLARADARFLCVMTNDAWYDPRYLIERGGAAGLIMRLPLLRQLAASGPPQHYLHAILRAVETRLPVVRSANTGISAIIGPAGDVHHQTPWGEKRVITDTLDVAPRPPTVYVSYGEWFAHACLMLVALYWLWRLAARMGWFRRRAADAPS
jgi:apolipoprotein N-acyltransferase